MRAQSSTCTWRIWLDGVTLVEQSLLIELLQEPPQCLDILVVVGNVRIIQINKITHLLGEVAPLLCEHHHVLAALLVIILG